MKKFRIDVRVVGFSEVVVRAETLEEAEDKAVGEVMRYQVTDLRWKETQCTCVEKEYLKC